MGGEQGDALGEVDRRAAAEGDHAVAALGAVERQRGLDRRLGRVGGRAVEDGGGHGAGGEDAVEQAGRRARRRRSPAAAASRRGRPGRGQLGQGAFAEADVREIEDVGQACASRSPDPAGRSNVSPAGGLSVIEAAICQVLSTVHRGMMQPATTRTKLRHQRRPDALLLPGREPPADAVPAADLARHQPPRNLGGELGAAAAPSPAARGAGGGSAGGAGRVRLVAACLSAGLIRRIARLRPCSVPAAGAPAGSGSLGTSAGGARRSWRWRSASSACMAWRCSRSMRPR